MVSTKIQIELGDVQETLLLPLYLRARESKRPDRILCDPLAEEIIQSIDYDFAPCDQAWRLQLDVAIRTEILDEQAERFIQQHPNAIIVNLGAGLDNRFSRLDNGRIHWFELDLPDTIELRRKYFDESDRHRFLSVSMFDFSWIDTIKRSPRHPLLLIAEGLVHYFTEDQMKLFFDQMATHLPGAEFLMHSISPLLVNRHRAIKGLNRMNAPFKWGIWTGRELEDWDTRYQFIKEWNFLERHRQRWRWMWWITRIPLMSRLTRGVLKVVHIRFRAEDSTTGLVTGFE